MDEVIEALAEQKVLPDGGLLREHPSQVVVHDPHLIEEFYKRGLVFGVVLKMVFQILYFEEQLKAVQHLIVVWRDPEQ